MLGGAGGVANVAVGEVRAADPNTAHLRGLPTGIRHGGHTFFGDELYPHAGQYGAGVDASAGGFGATVVVTVQPQGGGGGEQVGAGGGASSRMPVKEPSAS